LAIGHTALISPWCDPCIHIHQESEEFYLLLHGQLELYIDGVLVDLQPNELLMVLPQVPHAVIGGHGRIEHFGFRAPALDDKLRVGEIPSRLAQSGYRDEK
jgi:mannose-6-phosphate isomerase-like protein (cupin superfamily)